jgi:hypothetical protein
LESHSDTGWFGRRVFNYGISDTQRGNGMRSNYQHLLMDRYYLLAIGEMYHGALKEKEDEVDRFSYELMSTHDSLKSAQRALQESESWVEQLRRS